MKLRQILAAAIACLFTLNLASSGATKSATYTVASKTSVTVSGTTPDGSSAAYSQTYGTVSQATSGNSMTLTLSGYEGTTITGLTLSMKSNSKGGAGSMSMTSGGATLASISDSSFNNANWHGSWSTSYVDVTPNVTATTIGNNTVVITIAATANSLYCQSFTIEYTPKNKAPEATGTGSATTSVGVAATVNVSTFFNDPDGDTLTYTTDVGTISGSTLIYTPGVVGETTITVTATDPSGASATTTVVIEAIAGNVAPEVSVPQNSYSTTVGGSDITFTVTATGSPAPTITASCTEGAYFVFEDGDFLFEPDTAGTYHFVFTATNSEGSDSKTVTVTVKVTVPELTISNVADTTASASWTTCDDVSTYMLQLASDNQFTTNVIGGANVTLFSNPATSVTAPEGWTYDLSNSSGNYLQLLATDKSVVSPAVSTKGMASLSIGFKVRTYGGTSGDSGMTKVEYSSDGGVTWSEVGSITALSSTLTQKTIDASACIGLDAVQFRWTAPNAVSSKGIGIDTLSLSGVTAAVSGSILREETVTGTSYSFTGLTPETTYYARVKGNDAWSSAVEFSTRETYIAPTWSTIPAQSCMVGDTVEFSASDYLSGVPTPTVTLTSTADAADYEFDDGELLFEPSAAGTFTFVFQAVNAAGTATATLTVTAQQNLPPVITLSDTSVSIDLGETVEVLVEATDAGGTPALEVAAAYAQYFANGVFSWTPDAAGEYSIVFTATDVEDPTMTSTATLTVTVTRPPVLVPTLTVSDVADTTATASWTACDDVSSYTLQLASDDQFSAGTPDTILSENFAGFTASANTDISGSLNNYTATSGWTGYKVYSDSGKAKFGTGTYNGYIVTPSVNISAGATLSFSVAKYGSDTGTVDVQLSTNDGDFESLLDSQIAPQATAQTYTVSFAEAISGAKIKFVSSEKRFYLDDVMLVSAPVGGSVLSETTVNGTSYSFTGLTPETTYYARVKGNDAWSAVVEFSTRETYVAPTWSAIPAQTCMVGDDVEFTAATYLSGVPAPTITLTSSNAAAADYEFADGYLYFTPSAAGTFTFVFQAANEAGTASATLTITATASAPPTITLSQLAVNVNAGEIVTITASATDDEGTPTLAVAAEYAQYFENGTFSWTPSAPGVYDIIFTATDSEDATLTTTETLRVTVGLAAPTLSVSGTPAATSAVLADGTVTGADGYIITYSGVSSDTATRTVSTATFPVTLTGLQKGTEYTATAVATNGTYTSTASSAVTFTTFDLSEPANLAFSDTTHNSTTLSWDAVIGADSYLVSASYIPGTIVFQETFDGCTGKGGNDNTWSGSGVAGATLHADNNGWTFEHENGADQCAKFGSGSNAGSATTPALGAAGDFTLTFRAAAWNGSSESTTLHLSITGEGTLGDTSVTLAKGAWTSYTTTIEGATESTKIKFYGNSGNNRFFLDDVIVSQGSLEPVQVINNAEVSASATPSYTATGLSPETTYTFTVTAVAEVGGETVTSDASSADETTTSAPPPATTFIVF